MTVYLCWDDWNLPDVCELDHTQGIPVETNLLPVSLCLCEILLPDLSDLPIGT